jgi:predicted DNA-binding mobile mystery protein A
MTLEQMGTRIGRSRQAVDQLEHGEVNDTITLATLRSAANALDCDLVIGLKPRSGSLENTLRKQAAAKAHEDQAAVLQTMALENQTEGLEKKADVSADVEWWLKENSARLWD